jgi:long-subunit fatty acid transport protein
MLNDFYVNSVGDTIFEWWSPVVDEMTFSDTSATVEEMGVHQNKYVNTNGSNGEFFLSFGGNYADKLYIGATFGIQRVRYELTRTHHEYERDDRMLGFHSFEFIEHEQHSGTGYNLKVGAIYKPTNYLRIGAAIHTPTFYNLEYTWYNEMNSDLDGTTYSYDGDRYTFNYNLITPLRIETGLAYQLKNIGIISVDYERVDYSMAKLEDEEGRNIFGLENDSLNSTLGAANNIRIGGEVKLGQFYVRGGYALYQSPYNDSFDFLQSGTQIYSGGLGYREGNFFVDATFMRSITDRQRYQYGSVFGINNERTELEMQRDKIIVTVGLRF